jgi:hypothetical protein
LKKLLVVGLIGSAVVGTVVLAKGLVLAAPAATPEGKACLRMEELCETEPMSSKDMNECVDDMKHARKMAGDANFDRSVQCTNEAKSCAAAAGCWAGGVGMGAVGEMMKGFGSALSR